MRDDQIGGVPSIPSPPMRRSTLSPSKGLARPLALLTLVAAALGPAFARPAPTEPTAPACRWVCESGICAWVCD